MNLYLRSILLFIIIWGCKNDNVEKIVDKRPEQIVVISNNAPDRYNHYLNQDSLGTAIIDSSGPYSPVARPIFEYYNSQNNIIQWSPKPNTLDTIRIPFYEDILELSTRNPFTSIPHTFLIKNGDTVVLNYIDKVPHIKFIALQIISKRTIIHLG
jgi:hypothetical protein